MKKQIPHIDDVEQYFIKFLRAYPSAYRFTFGTEQGTWLSTIELIQFMKQKGIYQMYADDIEENAEDPLSFDDYMRDMMLAIMRDPSKWDMMML